MTWLPDIARQFAVFFGVGLINTAIGLSVILALSFSGVHYMMANAIGYGVGLCAGFVLHKKISFRDNLEWSLSLPQFRRFLAVFAVGYAVQFVCLFFFVHDIGWYEPLAQVIACGVYMVISYIGNRVWTFKSCEERD